ncbi:MAG: LrgB family protein [Synechococcus sp.]
MPDFDFSDIWVYLPATPLVELTVTLLVYNLAYKLYRLAKSNPLLNPVLTSILTLIALLLLTGTSYEQYFEGGQFIHFLLGPATVALAIPLYKQCSKLKTLWPQLAIAILSGVILSALSSVFLAKVLGATLETQLSIAPKSVTTPVAMGISEQIGGLPSLTAVLVVLTGILGSSIGPALLDWMRIRDNTTKGVALGIAAHGLGTARAFQLSSEMGAFAGLAMALSAFTTAVLLPGLMRVLG